MVDVLRGADGVDESLGDVGIFFGVFFVDGDIVLVVVVVVTIFVVRGDFFGLLRGLIFDAGFDGFVGLVNVVF